MTVMCDNLFVGVSINKLSDHCPIKIFPSCHPKASLEVFVDRKRKEITLVCSKCDKTISVIKVKHHDPRRTKKHVKKARL